jgi:hypothetical protein
MVPVASMAVPPVLGVSHQRSTLRASSSADIDGSSNQRVAIRDIPPEAGW